MTAADDGPAAVVPDFSVLGSTFEVDPEPIGVGAFGTVHFAMMRTGAAKQKAVAVKCIDKARTRAQAEAGGARTQWQELIEYEVDITSELGQTRHRNMPRFYGKWEDTNHVHLVLQLCEGGELPGWLLEQKSAYSERLASRIIYDALQAVLCCHDLGIVHRDLKPQNLLLTSDAEDARLLLVDFGLATRMEMGGPRLSEMCGTLDYMAPEMLQGSYDERVDVWAVGVLLHLLLTGAHPFRGPSQSATQERILALELDTSSALYHDVSPDALDMLRLLLSSQPSLRPSARAALRHAWLRRRNEQGAPLLPERIPAQLMAVCNQENWWVGSNASLDGRSVEGGSSLPRSPSPLRIYQRTSTSSKSLLKKSLSIPKFALPGGFGAGGMRGKAKDGTDAGSGLGDNGRLSAAGKRRKADAKGKVHSPRDPAALGSPGRGPAGGGVAVSASRGSGAQGSSSGEVPPDVRRTSSAAEQQLHWLKQQEVEYEEADEVEAAAEDVERAAAGARLAELLSTVQQRKVEVYYKKRVLGRLVLPRWQPALLSHYSEEEVLFLTIGAKPCRKLLRDGGSPASGPRAHKLMPAAAHGSRGSVLLGKGPGGPDVRLPIDKIERVSKIAGSQLRLHHAGEQYLLRLRDAAAAEEFASALQARMATAATHLSARGGLSPPARRLSVEGRSSRGSGTPTRGSLSMDGSDLSAAMALAEIARAVAAEAEAAKAEADARAGAEAKAEADAAAEAEAAVEVALAAPAAEAAVAEAEARAEQEARAEAKAKAEAQAAAEAAAKAQAEAEVAAAAAAAVAAAQAAAEAQAMAQAAVEAAAVEVAKAAALAAAARGAERDDDVCIRTAAPAAGLPGAAKTDNAGSEAAPYTLEREQSARRLQARSKPFWALKESKSSLCVGSSLDAACSEAEVGAGSGVEAEVSELLAAAAAATVTQAAVQSAVASALPEEREDPHKDGAVAHSGDAAAPSGEAVPLSGDAITPSGDAGAAASSTPSRPTGDAAAPPPFLGGFFSHLSSLFLQGSSGDVVGQAKSSPASPDASTAAVTNSPTLAAALPAAPPAAPSAPPPPESSQPPTPGGATSVAGASAQPASRNAAAASVRGVRLSVDVASSAEAESSVREEKTNRIFAEIAKRESSRGSPLSRRASAIGSPRASVSSTASWHALDSSQPPTPESVRGPAVAPSFTGVSGGTRRSPTKPPPSGTPLKRLAAPPPRFNVPNPPPRRTELDEQAPSPSRSRYSMVTAAAAPPLVGTSTPPSTPPKLASASSNPPPQPKVQAPPPKVPKPPSRLVPPPPPPVVRAPPPPTAPPPPPMTPSPAAGSAPLPRKLSDVSRAPVTPSPANALLSEMMGSRPALRSISSAPRPPSLPPMPVSPSDALLAELRIIPPPLRSVPPSPPRSRRSLPDAVPGLDTEWAAAGSPNRRDVPVGDFTVMWEQLITDVSQRSLHGSSTESLRRSTSLMQCAASDATSAKPPERKVSVLHPPVAAKPDTDTWGSIRATVRERKSMKGLQHSSSSPVMPRHARDNNTVREQPHTFKGLLHHSSLPLIARAGTEDTWNSIAESIRLRKSLRENRPWMIKEAAVTPS
jgi:serine/threonine protein kinase